ncbi:phosphorylase family protein [Pararcticibacter amylolyticus]|uniref:Nucleoside phosphorylase domain-containing protein n=1 Tax=Pararcticibacter amylolyticus TaxID=2173175 RepID=A0A2U2PD93_9SPHI|nr:prenyltransferase/squalene oxidase repeat-containing protein [Pararcticibacter amylolyticus]PWG79284.1 hypothetical protein DDR33_17325 [Pararcticibacter amylolyticus]
MITNSKLLQKVLNQSISEIENDFKIIDNSKGGWHQFLKSEKIGNVATAQALITLDSYDTGSEFKERAFSFLLENQLSSDNDLNDGGWPYVSNLPEVANTDSTCWVLSALQMNNATYADQIARGVRWLKKNFIRSSQYPGWGPTSDTGVRTYTTANVINTAIKLGLQKDEEFQLAIQALKRAQNNDGGWGEIPGAPSTLSHTSHVVIALLDSHVPSTNGSVQKAIKWIRKKLEAKISENGLDMGYSEMFDFRYGTPSGVKPQRMTFFHMPLAYAVLALIKSSESCSELINEAVMGLLKASDYGTFSHPLLLEKTIWAIFDVLKVLNEFKKSPYIRFFDEYNAQDPGKKKYDVIIFTVVPVEFLTLSTIFGLTLNKAKEDYTKNGLWYYEYTLERNCMPALSCLVTMIGGAGDVGCYSACSSTFQEFDCDLAVLCGIAAGNKNDIKKYNTIIAESVVAYEYQRLEDGNIKYRPKVFRVNVRTQRLIDKRDFYLNNWKQLIKDYAGKCGLSHSDLETIDLSKPVLKAGVIAAGAKLIANGKTLEVLKEAIPLEKGIIAAEMEASGFAPCCIHYNKEWVIFRGISDYGEDDKNDSMNKKLQPLAVSSAVATMVYFLKYIYRRHEEE